MSIKKGGNISIEVMVKCLCVIENDIAYVQTNEKHEDKQTLKTIYENKGYTSLTKIKAVFV